jgi:hypothetical protein
MPVKMHNFGGKYYFQWGKQKKYYFNPISNRSLIIAFNRAKRQGRAIKANK